MRISGVFFRTQPDVSHLNSLSDCDLRIEVTAVPDAKTLTQTDKDVGLATV